MNLRPRFSLKRLLRHGRAEVRRSLQARTVALTVILTLAVAIVFSGVSMVSVHASLLTQITSQSRADYSNMVQQAQTSLDAAVSPPQCRFSSWSMTWRPRCNPRGPPT